jgi:hypothetical protein
MSRNVYILAGTLGVLAAGSFVAGLVSAPTPALGFAWRTIALLLLLGGLLFALLATLTALFEQVDRRHRERQARARRRAH